MSVVVVVLFSICKLSGYRQHVTFGDELDFHRRGLCMSGSAHVAIYCISLLLCLDLHVCLNMISNALEKKYLDLLLAISTYLPKHSIYRDTYIGYLDKIQAELYVTLCIIAFCTQCGNHVHLLLFGLQYLVSPTLI